MKKLMIALTLVSALWPAVAQKRKHEPPPPPPEPVAASSPADDVKRDPNKIAVLSLLGDAVQLLNLTPQRGDTVQPGEWMASPAGGVDNAALQAIDQALHKQGRELKLYTSTTRSLYGDPSTLFAGGKLNLPGQLGEAVRSSGAGQLLLITRSRQEAGLAAALPARVLTSLEGPGFVLDQRPTAQIGVDGQGGLPVLAPFVSVRVALIDLGDLRLKRERSVAVAQRLTVGRDVAANPWAALSTEQRVKALEALIEAELPAAALSLLSQ
ncbi:MAG: hypothetical protein DI603_06480 [Roseateles depolymerans]|uniref:Uncharacterized protein n=1 Tax=Roseateles depolymerans TaxID=76731 RepID=A0A2W5FU70_9BURK|nr:MAG: hypothetical protein DI603_06480 [Roseateles depolymerans]